MECWVFRKGSTEAQSRRTLLVPGCWKLLSLTVRLPIDFSIGKCCTHPLFLSFYMKTLQSCRKTMKPEQDSVFLTSVSLSLNELSWWRLHNAAHHRKPVLAFAENCSSGSHFTWHTNCHPSLNRMLICIKSGSTSWAMERLVNISSCPRNVMLA